MNSIIVELLTLKLSVMETQSQVVNRGHVRDYFSYGIIAAILYLLPVLYLLFANKYQNLYLLYIGNALFMAVIYYYNYHLTRRPYEGKRAVSMLAAGHLATLVGTIISVVVVIIAMFIFFPDMFSAHPANQVLAHANSEARTQYPSGFLFMVLLDAILGNATAGSFVSILASYANKKNQMRDKPSDVGNRTVGTHTRHA
jgi:hypothetical protein